MYRRRLPFVQEIDAGKSADRMPDQTLGLVMFHHRLQQVRVQRHVKLPAARLAVARTIHRDYVEAFGPELTD